MKTINKLFGILFFTLLLNGVGISDTWAFISKSGYAFDGINICVNEAKISGVTGPRWGTNNYNGNGDTYPNIQALCHCKKSTNRNTNEGSYIYPNKQYVAMAFPGVAQCRTLSLNEWKKEAERYCSGFTKETFDGDHKVKVFDFTNGCWKWECEKKYEQGTTNKNICRIKDCGTGYARDTTDETKCIKKSTNTEYSGDTNSSDWTQVTPCDEDSTITVTLNGVKKTVQANTRVNDVCVPTCQSDMASSIDSSDATQFIILLNK